MEVTRAIKAFQDAIPMMPLLRCDAIMKNYRELKEEGWEADVAGAEKTVYKWKVAEDEERKKVYAAILAEWVAKSNEALRTLNKDALTECMKTLPGVIERAIGYGAWASDSEAVTDAKALLQKMKEKYKEKGYSESADGFGDGGGGD